MGVKIIATTILTHAGGPYMTEYWYVNCKLKSSAETFLFFANM